MRHTCTLVHIPLLFLLPSCSAEHVMAGLVTYMDQFKEGSFGKLALAVSCMIEVLLGDARRPECCGPAFYFGACCELLPPACTGWPWQSPGLTALM